MGKGLTGKKNTQNISLNVYMCIILFPFPFPFLFRKVFKATRDNKKYAIKKFNEFKPTDGVNKSNKTK